VKTILLGSLIAIAISARAGSVSPANEILSSLFNAELARADSLIDLSIRKHPNIADFYFLKAHHAFYMRYFTQQPVPRDSILNIIIDNGRKAIEAGERQPRTTEGKFFLGSAYGLVSRVHIMRQELWDGYWTARKSRNYLEEVLREDSTFFDAYIGLGVMEYYPSRLTGFQATLSWLAGMSGNRERGLEYFQKASEKGRLFKSEATLILAYVYRFLENDFLQAGSFFSRLHGEFPRNEYFITQHLQAQLAQRIDEQGSGFIEAGIDSLQAHYRINNSGALNGMAYGFVASGKREIALSLFKVNIELYPGEANPYDSIAECYLDFGDREMAIKYSRMALAKLPDDSTISEEFRESLRDILEERLNELGASPGV